jgi:sulfide:quinone oxidoreductase
MTTFRVAVCGGGVAAVEGALRVRRLLGASCELTLLAPNEQFRYRPMAGAEVLADEPPVRISLTEVAERAGATLVKGTLDWIDAPERVIHTEDGGRLDFDAALVAVGARPAQAPAGVLTFNPDDAAGSIEPVLDGIASGRVRSVIFLAPPAPAWPLPLYELALLTAARVQAQGDPPLELSLVTPEARPLAAFGKRVSDAVTGALEGAGIAVHAGTGALMAQPGRLRLTRRGSELVADQIIAAPRLTGPVVSGLSAGAHGFIPADRYCCVPRTNGRVFAAGDAVDFPVKHGGLGAQMADVAAGAIAQLAGLNMDVKPFSPVIRGKLLTGREPLYLEARLVGGQAFDSRLFEVPPWPSAERVVAAELGPFLSASSLAAA